MENWCMQSWVGRWRSNSTLLLHRWEIWGLERDWIAQNHAVNGKERWPWSLDSAFCHFTVTRMGTSVKSQSHLADLCSQKKDSAFYHLTVTRMGTSVKLQSHLADLCRQKKACWMALTFGLKISEEILISKNFAVLLDSVSRSRTKSSWKLSWGKPTLLVIRDELREPRPQTSAERSEGPWRGLLGRSSAGGRDLPSELLGSFSLHLSLSVGLNEAVVSIVHRFGLFRSAVPRWLYCCPTTIQKLLRGFRPWARSSGSEPAALLLPLAVCPTSPSSPRKLGVSLLPNSQTQLPKSKHCFPRLGGFLFQNIKSGWKIRKFYPTKRFLGFQEKKVLEQIAKRASSSISRVISNWFSSKRLLSYKSAHMCTPNHKSQSGSWGCLGIPTYLLLFQAWLQKVKDSKHSKASRSLQI